MSYNRSAREVFDDWAVDYHADGMETDHWPSVREAFQAVEPSDGVYLEVGVGNGYGLLHMARNQYRNGLCIGLDISPKMVENARVKTRGLSNVLVREADFLAYEPGERRPDLIFSMEVFYYFPDISLGVAHAFDILKPGGRLMVLVNHFRERLDSHDWPDRLDTPMQLWSKEQYQECFERTGFVDVGQRYVGIPHESEIRAVNPGTLATIGTKP